MVALNKTVNAAQLVFIFYWIKNLRYCAVLWTYLRNHFIETYGRTSDNLEDAKYVWERHNQWLEEIVRYGPVNAGSLTITDAQTGSEGEALLCQRQGRLGPTVSGAGCTGAERYTVPKTE